MVSGSCRRAAGRRWPRTAGLREPLIVSPQTSARSIVRREPDERFGDVRCLRLGAIPVRSRAYVVDRCRRSTERFVLRCKKLAGRLSASVALTRCGRIRNDPSGSSWRARTARRCRLGRSVASGRQAAWSICVERVRGHLRAGRGRRVGGLPPRCPWGRRAWRDSRGGHRWHRGGSGRLCRGSRRTRSRIAGASPRGRNRSRVDVAGAVAA